MCTATAVAASGNGKVDGDSRYTQSRCYNAVAFAIETLRCAPS